MSHRMLFDVETKHFHSIIKYSSFGKLKMFNSKTKVVECRNVIDIYIQTMINLLEGESGMWEKVIAESFQMRRKRLSCLSVRAICKLFSMLIILSDCHLTLSANTVTISALLRVISSQKLQSKHQDKVIEVCNYFLQAPHLPSYEKQYCLDSVE